MAMLAAPNVTDASESLGKPSVLRTDFNKVPATIKTKHLKNGGNITVDSDISADPKIVHAENQVEPAIPINDSALQQAAIPKEEPPIQPLAAAKEKFSAGDASVPTAPSNLPVAAKAEVSGTENNARSAEIPISPAVPSDGAIGAVPVLPPPSASDTDKVPAAKDMVEERTELTLSGEPFKIPQKGSDGHKRIILMLVNRWSILWKLLRKQGAGWRHRPPRGLEMGEGLYLTPGIKGQLREADKGVTWFCGTEAVIEYAMDRLPHLVAEVSRNIDYGQHEEEDANTTEATPPNEKLAIKDSDTPKNVVKAEDIRDSTPNASENAKEKPPTKSAPSQCQLTKQRRRISYPSFSVGDIVEVVRHREEPERNIPIGGRTLRVRYDQWFNATIIKIRPDDTTKAAGTGLSGKGSPAGIAIQNYSRKRKRAKVSSSTTDQHISGRAKTKAAEIHSLSSPPIRVSGSRAVAPTSSSSLAASARTNNSTPTASISSLPEHVIAWMRALSRDRLRQELRRRGLRATGAKAILLKRLTSYEARTRAKNGKLAAEGASSTTISRTLTPAKQNSSSVPMEVPLPKDYYIKGSDFGFSAKLTAALNAMPVSARVAMIKKTTNTLVKGNAAPKRSNLNHYLRTRPHMMVHTPSILGKKNNTKRRRRSRSNSSKGSDITDAETRRREERVKMFNPHTGIILRGMAAPKRKNLAKYLIRYPDMKVYTRGESDRNKRRRFPQKGDIQMPLLYDVKYEDGSIETGVKQSRVRVSRLGKMVTWRGEKGRITSSKNLNAGVIYGVYFPHNGVTKEEVRERDVELVPMSPVKPDKESDMLKDKKKRVSFDGEMDSNEEHDEDRAELGEKFGVLKLPIGWTREHRRRQRGDRAGQRYSVYFGPNGEVIHDSLTEVWRRSEQNLSETRQLRTKPLASASTSATATQPSNNSKTSKPRRRRDRSRSRSRSKRDRSRAARQKKASDAATTSTVASEARQPPRSKDVARDAAWSGASPGPLSSVVLFANSLHLRVREKNERHQRTRGTRSRINPDTSIDMNAFRRYLRRRQQCRKRRRHMREMISALLKRIDHTARRDLETTTHGRGAARPSFNVLNGLTNRAEMQLLRILVHREAKEDHADASMDAKYEKEMECEQEILDNDDDVHANPYSLLAGTEASAEKLLAMRALDADEPSDNEDDTGVLLRQTKLVPLPTLEDMRANNPGLVERINPTHQSGSSSVNRGSVCGGALALVTLTKKPTPIDRHIVQGKTSIKLVGTTSSIEAQSNGQATSHSKKRKRKKKSSSRNRRRRRR